MTMTTDERSSIQMRKYGFAFMILVLANAATWAVTAEEVQQNAAQIRAAINAKTVDEQFPEFQFVNDNYGKNPKSLPPQLKSALEEFLIQTASGKGPKLSGHGKRDASEFPLMIAMDFVDPESTGAATAFSMLAMRKDVSVRDRAVTLLVKGHHDSTLIEVGRALRDTKDPADSAVALYAYSKLPSIPEDSVDFIIDALQRRVPYSDVSFQDPKTYAKVFQSAKADAQVKLLNIMKQRGFAVPGDVKKQLQGTARSSEVKEMVENLKSK